MVGAACSGRQVFESHWGWGASCKDGVWGVHGIACQRLETLALILFLLEHSGHP